MLLLLYTIGALTLILIFVAFAVSPSKKVKKSFLKETDQNSPPDLKRQLEDEINRNKELERQLSSAKENLEIAEEEVKRLNSELKNLNEVHDGLKNQYDELERTLIEPIEDSNSTRLKEIPSIEQRLTQDKPS